MVMNYDCNQKENNSNPIILLGNKFSGTICDKRRCYNS